MTPNDSRAGFLMYKGFEQLFSRLDMQQRGELITAIFDYEINGEENPELSALVGMAFISIKQSLDRDNENYKKTCQKNSENGKKGGRPKKISCSKSERFFEKPKKADTDTDTKTDTKTDTETETKTETNPKPKKEIKAPHSVPPSRSESAALTESGQPSAPARTSDAHSGGAPQLSIGQERNLICNGVPIEYCNERLSRAFEYARAHDSPVEEVLYGWWNAENEACKRGIYRRYNVEYAEPREVDSIFVNTPQKTVSTTDFFRLRLREGFALKA